MSFKCSNKNCRFQTRREIRLWPFTCRCGWQYEDGIAAGTPPPAMIAIPSRDQRQVAPERLLLPAEKLELFRDTDPTLLGNRIAALTKAIGIPPCGACGKRQAWMNKAHAAVREMFG